MPRLNHLDTPGVLHHVIIRGIEHKKIFRDKTDRDNFIGRLARLMPETHTCFYAWVLTSNYFLCGAPHKKWLGIQTYARRDTL